LPFWSILRM